MILKLCVLPKEVKRTIAESEKNLIKKKHVGKRHLEKHDK